MLVLNVIQGPDKGRRFELPDTEPQLIGRSSEALPLTDSTISRRHAELTPDEGKWYINDLNSANGTFVNGQRITDLTLLRSGDQIRTGSTLMVFGRVSLLSAKPIRVLGPDVIDSAVEAAVPARDDSVITASPDPSAAAQLHLKIIYECMQLVGSIFDKQLLLERVTDLVFEQFEPDRGFILLRDTPEDRLEPFVVRYRRPPKPGEEKISVSRTIVQHVLTQSQGVLSSNAMVDKRFSAGESVHAFGIHSAICVPIKFRERVFGVIYIDSKVANLTFSPEQLRLMIAIGAMTGMALANAELYQSGVSRARLAAVGETVASLSHSIRNILQALRGGGEVVELGLRKKDLNLVSNGWDILSRNLDRIFELTMNMLAFSKQRKPEFEMVDVAKLLQEIAELMHPQCDKRNVALITEFDPDMPQIPADPSGLHQAVMNLLSNALDAVEPGGGVITLRCEYLPRTHEAIISVADNGPGLDAESRAKIFSPFYSTKGLRGTGLGLAVTRKIVQEHGGKIDVHSAPQQGATFTLTFSSEWGHDPSATRG
jgi:signal transduction histidine kinase